MSFEKNPSFLFVLKQSEFQKENISEIHGIQDLLSIFTNKSDQKYVIHIHTIQHLQNYDQSFSLQFVSWVLAENPSPPRWVHPKHQFLLRIDERVEGNLLERGDDAGRMPGKIDRLAPIQSQFCHLPTHLPRSSQPRNHSLVFKKIQISTDF